MPQYHYKSYDLAVQCLPDQFWTFFILVHKRITTVEIWKPSTNTKVLGGASSPKVEISLSKKCLLN